MPIWKLTPLDTTSDHWQASTRKDYIIVRAANESEARATAHSEFLIAAKRVPRGDTPLCSPWKQSNLVSCQRLENSEYEEEGSTKVLYPIPSPIWIFDYFYQKRNF